MSLHTILQMPEPVPLAQILFTSSMPSPTLLVPPPVAWHLDRLVNQNLTLTLTCFLSWQEASVPSAPGSVPGPLLLPASEPGTQSPVVSIMIQTIARRS